MFYTNNIVHLIVIFFQRGLAYNLWVLSTSDHRDTTCGEFSTEQKTPGFIEITILDTTKRQTLRNLPCDLNLHLKYQA